MMNSTHIMKPRSAYAPGAFPMPLAPRVRLPDGSETLPQHYLRYAQTALSLAELLQDISFDEHTLLFSGEDAGSLYLQVGLIGRENYDRGNHIRPHKLVYGRKWRIEADTPNSEIIQTAMLAIKKVREHEVRELFTLRPHHDAPFSAALSNHQDCTILSSQRDFLQAENLDMMDRLAIKQGLANLQFGQRPFVLLHLERRHNAQWMLDLELGAAPLARMQEADLPEFNALSMSLILRELTMKELIYAIMDYCIQHSDRYVEEQFRIAQFARFSRQHDPLKIAHLSLATRPYARDAQDRQFSRVFRENNYEVDASRAPILGVGKLAQINREKLKAFKSLHGALGGHLPIDVF